ncbi:unnamed protein product, partial [Symbiodinium sp. KB8]
SGLPVEAAIEFIDVVARKTATGHLKDPSNYVCATIARGYVPQAKLPSWQGHASFEAPPPASAVMLDMDMAAARLQSTDGMRKAEQAGIDLNQDALNALLRLPTQNASQLLEQVVEKQGTIRDLSNYVCATVARGFHPKESTGTVWSGLPNRAETEVPGAKAKGKGKATMENKGIELVPPDVTLMERAVLDLNQRDLWNGQNLDANSLLALRCLPQEQAMDLLGSLYSKGTGKGGVSIANPNNYLQAAIAKIVRTGMSNGMNFTGNQTRQKAAELGLSLEDLTLKALARLPLRSSLKLLESAAAAQMEGADPNAVIIAEASMLEAQDISRKRPRDTI